jgi:hypothetical protein
VTYTAQGKRNAVRAFKVHIGSARQCLGSARRFIEAAERVGAFAGLGEKVDQVGCYASNVLEGSLALLREMEALAKGKVRRP